MPKIESPQFKRSIGSPNSLREFPPVGMPEELPMAPEHPFPPQNGPHNNFPPNFHPQQMDLTQEDMEAIKRAREDKANPVINSSAKKRLEYLADLGRITKEVEIEGHRFILRTLKSKETKNVYTTVARNATNGVEELVIYRQYSLAHALHKIDNQTLEMYLDINTFEQRLAFIDGLEENVTYQLYLAYETLRQEANQQFSIKNEGDAKELGDDLKK